MRYATPGIILSLLVISFTLGACGERKKPEQAPTTRSGAAAPTSRKPVPVEAPYKPVPQGPSVPGRTNMETGQLDTADGTLTVIGSDAASGTWKFEDVTALLDEKAGAGATVATFTLEGHNGPANLHFRIRLRNEKDEITPGTYSVGGDSRKLDARWENGSGLFTSALGGKGTVELKSIGNGRAVGSFNLTLHQADEGAPPQTLKGTFNQALVK